MDNLKSANQPNQQLHSEITLYEKFSYQNLHYIGTRQQEN